MKSTYTEEDVQRALDAVANGMSRLKASQEHGVPRSTIRNRINGHISRIEAHEPQQRLSLVQEQRLTDWILTQEALGLSPTHAQIRQFAGRVLDARGDAKPLGKQQMDGFKRRNPILVTKRQFRIDSARVNSTTTEIIKKWFQKLMVPRIKAIKPENRWNIDKAEIIEGQGENRLVVGSREKRFVQRK